MASVLSSLRYLLSDFIGEDDDDEPFLPRALPDSAASIVSEAIHQLIEYQGAAYAQLYVDRLRRFVGKPGVDDAMFCEIARLMAMRMSYQDPVRIAQLKLAELDLPPAIRAPRRPTTSGNSGSMNWSKRSPRRSPSRFSGSSNAWDGCAGRSRSASAPGTACAFAA